MSRGLFVGRFQPFHLGHIATITYALDDVRFREQEYFWEKERNYFKP